MDIEKERAAFIDNYRERNAIPEYVPDNMVWESQSAQDDFEGWCAGRKALANQGEPGDHEVDKEVLHALLAQLRGAHGAAINVAYCPSSEPFKAAQKRFSEAYESLFRVVDMIAAAPPAAVPAPDASLLVQMAEFIADKAVAQHYDSNGPDYLACACCDAEIPINRFTSPDLKLEHKDDCLFVKAQAILAAQAMPTEDSAAPAQAVDASLLTWLDEQVVDVIYLDDGRIIDVKGYSVRPAIAAAMGSAALAAQPAAPVDPMDWPLPCDVTVGAGTNKKGTKLRTLVTRMKMLHDVATKGLAAPAGEPVAVKGGAK